MSSYLLLDNLPLAIVLAALVYAWYRTSFRTPRVLGLGARTPARIVVALGWFLIAAIVTKSMGGAFFGDGRVSIGERYAYRAREPVLFWGEIAGEMLLVGGMGCLLIHLGRRSARG